MNGGVKIEFRLLTPSRWRDSEELFGKHGACGGCWCMWWRPRRSDFEREHARQEGEGNKSAMKRTMDSGETLRILAYVGNKAVGWCSVGPREVFKRLGRSRILKPVDAQPVWSVVCLFVTKSFRRRGASVRLMKAAIDYVERQRGRIVEGYASEPGTSLPDVFVYTGLTSAFRKAGYTEALRRSKKSADHEMRCR